MTARRGAIALLALVSCASLAPPARAILPGVQAIAVAECIPAVASRGFRFTVLSDGSLQASYGGQIMHGCTLQEGWTAFTFADVEEREFAGAQVRALDDGRLEVAFCRAVRLSARFAVW
jgi:hypothetical protein